MEEQVLSTPLGGVRIETEGGKLVELNLTDRRGGRRAPKGAIAKELDRFFRGEVQDLNGIPVDLRHATDFERRVYEATRAIPFGKVATYGQIAKAIGEPGAARAVGNALGKNPIALVIPCHRVVASTGIGGFTGGLEWKRKLLRFEGSLKSLR